MITSFSGKNYKAFSSFQIEFKPLTILLGANSCGKSAIINSLLMLSQTTDSLEVSEAPLRLNGNKVGLGDTLNIIRNKNPNEILEFSFEINDKEIKESISMLRRKFTEDIYLTCFSMEGALNNENINKRFASHYRSIMGRIHQSNLTTNQLTQISSQLIKMIKIFRESPQVNLTKFNAYTRGTAVSLALATKVSYKKIEDTASLLANSLAILTPKKVTYKYSYKKTKGTLEINEYIIYNKKNEIILAINKNGTKSYLINSDIFDQSMLTRSKKEIIKLLDFSAFSLSTTKSFNRTFVSNHHLDIDKIDYNPFAQTISQLISITSNYLIQNLSNLQINHVSPLRAFPQRYYLLDKSIKHQQLNVLDGTELAEILKKNPHIKEKINLLLAQFNLAVEVEKVNDIIHKIVVNQGPVYLELTDVGFGISQVLPILTQAYLSPTNSLTIIEQPEIHLHPSMQAWLADALITIALNEKKKFLIETHSEALIRRIRLRVVDDNSPLSSNDINIYHLEKKINNSSTTINRVDISPLGDIEWPQGFLDTEINDTINIQKLRMSTFSNPKNEG